MARMIKEYVLKYLPKARYKKMDGKIYADIKELRGVWAMANTKEECKKELAEVIEGWVLFRLEKGLPIPDFNIQSHHMSQRSYA